MLTKRFSLLVLVLLVSSLILAACGDEEEDPTATAQTGTTATSSTGDASPTGEGEADATPSEEEGTATSASEETPTGAAEVTPTTGVDATAPAETTPTESASAATSEPIAEGTLRLGYFPNVTHAPAIIGVENGIFAEHLGENVTLKVEPFNVGTEAIEALFGDAIDATFIGPNPAINGFAQSDGEALRIVAGTTSGGAFLVVNPNITSIEQLEGTTIATPSLGNTQDVALRAWLLENGFETDTTGGGDVSILPQSNADTLAAFQQGDIDGAWVPEPWATRLIQEGGGVVLVDEADLWPDGQFVTTHLIVSTEFLEERPDIVKALLEGLIESIEYANSDDAEARTITNQGIEAVLTTALPEAVIDASWENLTFTWDPIASSLQKSKDNAVLVGLLEDVDLTGIYDLTLLNEILVSRGEEEVQGL
jgi:NitT/TauT family transport system substrate-binding protein